MSVIGPEYSILWTTISGDGQQIAFSMEKQSDYADSLQIASYREEFFPHWVVTKVLTPFGAIGPRYMEWSPVPGSKQLAYSDGTGNNIINTESGVITNYGPGSQPTWSGGTKLYFSGGKGLAYITLGSPTVTTISARGPNHPKYRN